MGTEKFSELLKRISDRWDRTEAVIKRAELTTTEVVIPAVFELRYAGRRLVDAIQALLAENSPDKEEKINAYILEVEQFCFRAQHDSVDAIVDYLVERLQFMEHEFGIALLAENFPSYATLNTRLDKLQKTVVDSRHLRGKRSNIYDDLQDKEVPLLIEQIESLNASEKALIAIAEKQRSEDKRRDQEHRTTVRVLWWTIAGVIIAAVIGIVGLIIAIEK